MPLLTVASAVSRMSFSFTSQPNLFQLFHPIGVVAASTPSVLCAAAKPDIIVNRIRNGATLRFITSSPMTFFRYMFMCILQLICLNRSSSRQSRGRHAWLLQSCVFRSGLFQDGDIRVGIFPESEEILVSGPRTGWVPSESTGLASSLHIW